MGNWMIFARSRKALSEAPANLFVDRYGHNMLKLRKAMCRCFRFLAMVSLLVSFFSLLHLFRPIHPHGLSHGTRSPAHSDLLLSMFFHVLIIILRVTPVAMAFLYGMAWWKVKTVKPSGRGWAIAASLAILLLVFPFSTVTYYAFLYAPAGSWIGFLIPIGVVLALGILGLVAFAPRDSIGQTPMVPAKAPADCGRWNHPSARCDGVGDRNSRVLARQFSSGIAGMAQQLRRCMLDCSNS